MTRQLYIVQTCNVWKETSSARIYDACTTLPRLRQIIANGIRNEFFCYEKGAEDGVSFKKQERMFRDDWKATDADHDRDAALDIISRVGYAIAILVEECGSCRGLPPYHTQQLALLFKQLDAMDDLRFAQAILNERLNGVSNAYSPLAIKLRCAAAKLGELADAKPVPAPCKEPHEPYLSYEGVFEALGWTVNTYKDGSMEIGKHSPAGEDFWFSIEGEDIPTEVREYAEEFDADEHVDLWAQGRGERGVPQSYRELVEDAEAIQEMLDNLADALDSVQDNCELGIYDCSTCIIHDKCDREDAHNEEVFGSEDDGFDGEE